MSEHQAMVSLDDHMQLYILDRQVLFDELMDVPCIKSRYSLDVGRAPSFFGLDGFQYLGGQPRQLWRVFRHTKAASTCICTFRDTFPEQGPSLQRPCHDAGARRAEHRGSQRESTRLYGWIHYLVSGKLFDNTSGPTYPTAKCTVDRH